MALGMVAIASLAAMAVVTNAGKAVQTVAQGVGFEIVSAHVLSAINDSERCAEHLRGKYENQVWELRLGNDFETGTAAAVHRVGSEVVPAVSDAEAFSREGYRFKIELRYVQKDPEPITLLVGGNTETLRRYQATLVVRAIPQQGRGLASIEKVQEYPLVVYAENEYNPANQNYRRVKKCAYGNLTQRKPRLKIFHYRSEIVAARVNCQDTDYRWGINDCQGNPENRFSSHENPEPGYPETLFPDNGGATCGDLERASWSNPGAYNVNWHCEQRGYEFHVYPLVGKKNPGAPDKDRFLEMQAYGPYRAEAPDFSAFDTPDYCTLSFYETQNNGVAPDSLQGNSGICQINFRDDNYYLKVARSGKGAAICRADCFVTVMD